MPTDTRLCLNGGRFAVEATWRDFAGHTGVGHCVGLSGDTGYSEAPHLHYTVRRAGGSLLCPTSEPGFSDGGWLGR